MTAFGSTQTSCVWFRVFSIHFLFKFAVTFWVTMVGKGEWEVSLVFSHRLFTLSFWPPVAIIPPCWHLPWPSRQKFFDPCWHVLLFSHLRGKVSIHRPLRAMHYCFGPHETNFLLLPTPCWVLSRLRLSQIHWARPLMQRFLLSCWQCSLCGLLNENISLSSHQLCAQIPKLIYRYYFFYPPWVLRAELSKQSFSEIPVSI